MKRNNLQDQSKNNSKSFEKEDNLIYTDKTPITNKDLDKNSLSSLINISPLFTIKKNLYKENMITPKISEFMSPSPINSLIKNIKYNDISPFDINKFENSDTNNKVNLNNTTQKIDFFQIKNITKNSNKNIIKKEEKNCCNCIKTKCLKLYCECFRSEKLCDSDCICKDCKNNELNKNIRDNLINLIKKKKPTAFKNNKLDKKIDSETFKGCFCQKTNCLKNYCECFVRNLNCTDKCKCINCKNINIKNNKFEKKLINNQKIIKPKKEKYDITETKKKLKKIFWL